DERKARLAEERRLAADERKHAAEERRRAAEERRAQLAEERRLAADERKHAAEERRRAAEERRARLAEERRLAAEQRRLAAEERRRAAEERRRGAEAPIPAAAPSAPPPPAPTPAPAPEAAPAPAPAAAPGAAPAAKPAAPPTAAPPPAPPAPAPKPASTPAPAETPAPTAEPPATEAPGDTAVFAMVVNAPRSIRAETLPPGPGTKPPVVVERSLAGATVVSFPSPRAKISERDREAVESLARLAADQGLDVAVWARAPEPDRLPEATRRAEEVRALVRRAGKLPAGRVSMRVTTRPGAEGVEVVVSALRSSRSDEEPPPPPAPGGAAPAPAPAPAPLGKGENARRRVREAVRAVQPALQACLAPVAQRRGTARAEGVLRITVDGKGKVKAVSAAGDLSGEEVEACLRAAAAGWTFPAGARSYSVDVPVTLVREGARR
ncbi:MAG TPA: hypothetical protein VLS93_00630, partial [Anaeromyxobacteraceae bacterium]|nr:hypothetical protein [Anaeromyxobacteraceae bacterium]